MKGLPKRSLLAGAHGHVIYDRARWVLDLDELQRLCLPSRTWVWFIKDPQSPRDGEGDWSDIWMRSRDWPGPPSDTPRTYAYVLRRALARIGIPLAIVQLERVVRVHVGAPELRELVLEDLDLARRLLAARDDIPADDLELPIAAGDVVENYRAKKWRGKRSIRSLSRQYGRTRRQVRKILEGANQEIAPAGHPAIEAQVSNEVLERALSAIAAGASTACVARILGCTWTTADRFRDRRARGSAEAS